MSGGNHIGPLQRSGAYDEISSPDRHARVALARRVTYGGHQQQVEIDAVFDHSPSLTRVQVCLKTSQSKSGTFSERYEDFRLACTREGPCQEFELNTGTFEQDLRGHT